MPPIMGAAAFIIAEYVDISYIYVIPVIATHLFCFYFGILADNTPPVGLAAYTASAIAESDPIPTGIQGFLYDIRISVIAFLFVFNPELLLIHIDTWPHGLMIFGMALLGMAAFENVAQGSGITRNIGYEIPLFLIVSLTLFHPGAVASFCRISPSMKYVMYLAAMALYGLIMMSQNQRKKQPMALADKLGKNRFHALKWPHIRADRALRHFSTCSLCPIFTLRINRSFANSKFLTWSPPIRSGIRL